jgi:NAD(P)-dependent dehydrogenase (short-subunit alcohol dehydrogenase family)
VEGKTVNNRFSGKVALIAGGTGGLGRAVSLAFLEEGAKVVVSYRDEKEWNELKSAAAANISSITGYRVDVTDAAEVDQFIQQIVTENGHLEVVVNTVGAYAGGMKLWEMDPKVFDQMLALNLRSGFALFRAAAPIMLRQGRGAIVSVASKAAVDHAGGAAAYAVSKAAAVAMVDCLAADLKGTGVRANSILPSIIDTVANRRAMPGADFAKWPKPEDIARVILFLCSDEAQLIHGAAVPVYGES